MEKLLKFIPLLSTLLIFFGVFHLFVFYSAFNINIFNYLDFSEIITSFLHQLIFILLEVFGAIIFGVFYFPVAKQSAIKYSDLIHTNNYSFLQRLILNIKRNIIFLLIMLWLNIFLVIAYFKLHIFSLNFFVICLLTNSYLMLVNIFSTELNRFFNSHRETRMVGKSMIVLIILLLLLYLYTTVEVEQITRRKYHSGIIIQLVDKEKLISDSNSYYIGNTKNYLFFYYKNSYKTRVIPMSRVEEINIIKKPR